MPTEKTAEYLAGKIRELAIQGEIVTEGRAGYGCFVEIQRRLNELMKALKEKS